MVALVAAALAGWLYLVSIALPALSDARAGAALHAVQPGASDAALEDAAARAAFAARLDPLAVRPLFAGAAIADRRGRVLEERRLLLDAVHRQPSSAQGWLRLADVALGLGDAEGVAAATDRALELDPRSGHARDAAAAALALDAPPSASPAATGTPLP